MSTKTGLDVNPPKPFERRTFTGYTIPCRRESKAENRSPGPAGYDVINLSVYKQSAPGYSIKGRTKEVTKKTISPGPKYLPQIASQGPKGYTFGMRTKNGPYIIPEDRSL